MGAISELQVEHVMRPSFPLPSIRYSIQWTDPDPNTIASLSNHTQACVEGATYAYMNLRNVPAEIHHQNLAHLLHPALQQTLLRLSVNLPGDFPNETALGLNRNQEVAVSFYRGWMEVLSRVEDIFVEAGVMVYGGADVLDSFEAAVDKWFVMWMWNAGWHWKRLESSDNDDDEEEVHRSSDGDANIIEIDGKEDCENGVQREEEEKKRQRRRNKKKRDPKKRGKGRKGLKCR